MIVSQDGTRRITAEELDERFDNGEELDEFFDTEHPRRIEPDSDAIFTVTLTKKINLDLPLDMVEQIDAQARRIGQPRQSLLRTWIWERLRREQELDLRLGVCPMTCRQSAAAPESATASAPATPAQAM